MPIRPELHPRSLFSPPQVFARNLTGLYGYKFVNNNFNSRGGGRKGKTGSVIATCRGTVKGCEVEVNGDSPVGRSEGGIIGFGRVSKFLWKMFGC